MEKKFMPHEKGAGSPQDWLRLARADLALASIEKLPGIPRLLLCFHLQQAAEKAIKAVLVKNSTIFPYTHDLAVLISLLKNSKINIPLKIEDAVELTQFAVAARYPAPEDDIDDQEFDKYLTQARSVVEWAEAHL